MKKQLLLTCIFILSSMQLYSQNRVSALNLMIKAEYDFAVQTGEVGIRDGFLKFIDDSAVVFNPVPVNGKDYYTAAKPSKAYLSWYPEFARTSKSGDLGVTSGPWYYKKNKEDLDTLACGTFCSIWKQSAAGIWKFVVDIGTDNAKPVKPIPGVKYKNDEIKSSKDNPKIDGKLNLEYLIGLEKELAKKAGEVGLSTAYKNNIAAESRIQKDGEFPLKSKTEISSYLSGIEGQVEIIPVNGGASKSEDFGYTYGALKIKSSKNELKEYYYLHVWQYENGQFKLLVEVLKNKEAK